MVFLGFIVLLVLGSVMSFNTSHEDFEQKVSAIINSRESEELEVADAFFMHQVLVRRFKSKSNKEFKELVNIRYEIENFLTDDLLPYFPYAASLLNAEYIVNAVMSLMYEVSKNWHSYLSIKKIHDEIVQKVLDKHDEVWQLELESELIETVKQYMEQNQQKFNSIVESFNYFDFYTPLEMTLEVDGQMLLYIYCTVFYELESHAYLTAWSGFTLAETKWLYVYDTGNHELDYFFTLGFPRYKSNVHIIINEGKGGEKDNEVYINNIRTSDSIYLKLPLNESPKMLDRKLEQLKNTLHHYYQAKSVNENFTKQSLFFKQKYKDSRCLIKERKRSMLKVIYSIACWDLSKRSKEMTVNMSIDELFKDLEKINNELKECEIKKSFVSYNKDTSKKYYDWMASLIEGNNIDVDKFLTGGEIEKIGRVR